MQTEVFCSIQNSACDHYNTVGFFSPFWAFTLVIGSFIDFGKLNVKDGDSMVWFFSPYHVFTLEGHQLFILSQQWIFAQFLLAWQLSDHIPVVGWSLSFATVRSYSGYQLCKRNQTIMFRLLIWLLCHFTTVILQLASAHHAISYNSTHWLAYQQLTCDLQADSNPSHCFKVQHTTQKATDTTTTVGNVTATTGSFPFGPSHYFVGFHVATVPPRCNCINNHLNPFPHHI